jgi:hypothetical protein
LYTVTTSRFTKAKANHGIAKPLFLKEKIYFWVLFQKSQLVSIGSVEFIAYKHQYIHISCAFKIVNIQGFALLTKG